MMGGNTGAATVACGACRGVTHLTVQSVATAAGFPWT